MPRRECRCSISGDGLVISLCGWHRDRAYLTAILVAGTDYKDREDKAIERAERTAEKILARR